MMIASGINQIRHAGDNGGARKRKKKEPSVRSVRKLRTSAETISTTWRLKTSVLNKTGGGFPNETTICTMVYRTNVAHAFLGFDFKSLLPGGLIMQIG